MNGKNSKTQVLVMAIKEDIHHRPKLYHFLKAFCEEEAPYELLHTLFWASLQYLSVRQRNIILDDLVFCMSEEKVAQKYEISRASLRVFKQRAKKKLYVSLSNHLAVERAILNLKKRKIK